jgi:hypothetical protein
MTLETYIPLAIRTESSPRNVLTALLTSGQGIVTINESLIRELHAVFGLQTEVGELMEASYLAKHRNLPIDKVNWGEEIGDAFWYDAVWRDTRKITSQHCVDAHYSDVKGCLDSLVVCTARLVDAYKKHLFYGKPLGDVNGTEDQIMARILQLAAFYNLNPNDIRQRNIEKLEARYKKNTFDAQEAQHRDLNAERTVLEQQG